MVAYNSSGQYNSSTTTYSGYVGTTSSSLDPKIELLTTPDPYATTLTQTQQFSYFRTADASYDFRKWFEWDGNLGSNTLPLLAATGSPTQAVGVGYTLNGTSQHLASADDPLWDCDTGQEITVYITFRPSSLPATAGTIIGKRDTLSTAAASAAGWQLLLNSTGTVTTRVSNGSTVASSTTTGTVTVGQRAVTALRITTTQAQVNLNGTWATAAARPTGSLANAVEFRIGRLGGAGTNYFAGTIQQALVFRTAHNDATAAAVIAWLQSTPFTTPSYTTLSPIASTPGGSEFYDVVSNGSRLVAVTNVEAGLSFDGISPPLWSDNNGAEWWRGSLPGRVSTDTWRSAEAIRYNGSRWIAIGRSGTDLFSGPGWMIWWSDDGINWTPAVSSLSGVGLTNFGLSNSRPLGVVWDGSRWVASFIAIDPDSIDPWTGTISVYTSEDGAAWTFQSNAATDRFGGITTPNSLTYGQVGSGGRYVIVITEPVSSAATDASILFYSSTNLTTWTRTVVPVSGGNCNGLVYGNGVFLARIESVVTDSDGNAIGYAYGMLRSTDGVSWSGADIGTAVNEPGQRQFGYGFYISFIRSEFVVTRWSGQSSSTPGVVFYRSRDGARWAPTTGVFPASPSYSYGGSHVVEHGERLLISPLDVATPAPASTTTLSPIYSMSIAEVWATVTTGSTGISIERGRSRDLEEYAAGTATITFRNESGAFDPSNTSSPYYPHIRVYGKMRISCEDGEIFTGYIRDYEVVYEQPRFSMVTVSLVDELTKVANLRLVNTSFSQQSSGARVAAILDASGNSLADKYIQIDKGLSPIPAISGVTDDAITQIRNIEDVEQGAFFATAAGVLKFRSRSVVPPLSGLTFTDQRPLTTGEVGYSSIERSAGLDLFYNQVDVTRLGGTTPQSASDPDSVLAYGVSALSYSNLPLATDAEALALAQWLCGRYSEPEFRVARVSIPMNEVTGLTRAKLFTLDIGDLVVVEFQPPGRSLQTYYVRVEGISHERMADSPVWTTSLSFAAAQTEFELVLDDDIYGLLDNGLIGY